MNEELIQKVEVALDKIRPYLKTDGGDVRIVEITEDNVVRLELLGACGSCSMSSMTMKTGIEETVIRDVPEINKVEAINA